MSDYGSGASAKVTVIEQSLESLDEFVYAESADEVGLEPGDEEIIVSITKTFDWFITHAGATDADETEYYLKIGDDETPHTDEPFGLYNDPFRFSPVIPVAKNIEAAYYAKLAAAAPGSVKYVAKIIGFKR